MDELKPKPFRARPVPRSHYNEPYRPELPSKKDRQPKIAAKKVDTAHPGLASRIWKNKMVDPILHPNDKVEDTGNAQEKPVEKVTAEVPLSPESAPPGLVSRVWHSVVDPILHPNKEHDEKLLELQPDGEETEVVEESMELNVDPQIPKVDEMITPEIAQTQPESDEIPAETDEGASVNVESSALIPDAVIETPVLKDVTGTRKKKRRHENRHHSDSYLEKLFEECIETKETEKPEEPIAQPGLLKRSVFGIGSTALGAGNVTG
jgi:hypothetical protein